MSASCLRRCFSAAALATMLASCGSDAESATTTESATASSTTSGSTASSSIVDTAVESTPPAPSAQPDCTGGPAILETTVLDSLLVVRESTDGRIFCIEDAVYGDTFGSVPDDGSVDTALRSAGMYGRAWYLFSIGADLPAIVTVFNEDGDELPAARGRAGDYLVVIDPLVGQDTGAPPEMVPRTLDVRDRSGTSVSQLVFQGFGASEHASYEQFAACVRDAGVAMAAPPAPGETLPPREPTPREALQKAWAECADMMFSYMVASQQGGPDYLENFRFEMNCVAAAGFYPMLNEPHSDQAAFELADLQCRALGPGRTALVECLQTNGLDIVVDGVQHVGPYPPEATDRAWQACRDIFATWEVSSPIAVADRMPPMDCMAARGWITAVLVPADFADPALLAARQECPFGG